MYFGSDGCNMLQQRNKGWGEPSQSHTFLFKTKSDSNSIVSNIAGENPIYMSYSGGRGRLQNAPRCFYGSVHMVVHL